MRSIQVKSALDSPILPQTSARRRRPSLRWLACLVLLALVTTVAPAGAWPTIEVGGSWKGSCDQGQASTQGLVLAATCTAIDGSMRQSSLDVTTCNQPPAAANIDGVLKCEGGLRNPPFAGDWYRSCAYESVSGSVINAYCADESGQLVPVAALDTSACKQPPSLENVNGRLVCDPAPPPQPTRYSVDACTDGWSYSYSNGSGPELVLGLITPAGADKIGLSIGKDLAYPQYATFGVLGGTGSLSVRLQDFGSESLTRIFTRHQLVHIDVTISGGGPPSEAVSNFSIKDKGSAC